MKTTIATLALSATLLWTTSVMADEQAGDKVEIDSQTGKESVTIQESQTGDQSEAGTAITDDPVDDNKKTDEDDNTDVPKYGNKE